MTTLPDDVIEFLKRLIEVYDDSVDTVMVSIARHLLDKYPTREFNGMKNETWAIPPELVRDR
jgi:hypothetical protein